jgi:hypothetical protein
MTIEKAYSSSFLCQRFVAVVAVVAFVTPVLNEAGIPLYEQKRLQRVLHLPTFSPVAHSLYGRIDLPEKMCQGLRRETLRYAQYDSAFLLPHDPSHTSPPSPLQQIGLF